MCLVTDDDDARSDTEHNQALEVDAALWSDARIRTLWKARDEFDRGVNAGSVEEAIAREGKVLAGDDAIVTGAAVKPFRASPVRADLIVARAHPEAGIWIAQAYAGAQSKEARCNATLALSIDAIAAIEALGRALFTLTGTPQAGTHDLGVNGRRMEELGEAAGDHARGRLLHAIGARLVAVDRDGARLRHAEQWGEPRESYEDVAERLALGLETDMWTRRGLVAGEGPWARLAQHPRAAELREAIADDTTAAAGAAEEELRAARVALGSDMLERAATKWYEGARAPHSEATADKLDAAVTRVLANVFRQAPVHPARQRRHPRTQRARAPVEGDAGRDRPDGAGPGAEAPARDGWHRRRRRVSTGVLQGHGG